MGAGWLSKKPRAEGFRGNGYNSKDASEARLCPNKQLPSRCAEHSLFHFSVRPAFSGSLRVVLLPVPVDDTGGTVVVLMRRLAAPTLETSTSLAQVPARWARVGCGAAPLVERRAILLLERIQGGVHQYPVIAQVVDFGSVSGVSC